MTLIPDRQAARTDGAAAWVRCRSRVSSGAEEVLGVDKFSHTGCARRGRINLLITHHRRAGEINAVRPCEILDHPAFGLAAFASVGVVMRTDLPRRQDSAELVIEFSQRGFDLLRAIATA